MKLILMHSIHLTTLQTLQQFQVQHSKTQTLAFVIGLVVIIAIVVFLNVSKAVKNSRAFKGEAVDLIKHNKAQVSAGFLKEASRMGLTKHEAITLEKILRAEGSDPFAVLKNKDDLDDHFKIALQHLRREAHNESVENEVAEIFSIRNIIEYHVVSSNPNSVNRIARSFPRKSISELCTFYYVSMIKQQVEKKTIKKLVTQKEKNSGTLINLSIGGAALKTTTMKNKSGQLLKIEFPIKRQQIAALGEILRINTEGNFSIMHLKFLKISKKSLNSINNLIYGYE